MTSSGLEGVLGIGSPGLSCRTMKGSVRQVLLLAAVCATLFAGAAIAANSGSFSDPSGDADTAPDVTALRISNDDAGTVKIEVTLGNRSALTPDDEVTIGIDADQNPDSGGVFYGADLELSL